MMTPVVGGLNLPNFENVKLNLPNKLQTKYYTNKQFQFSLKQHKLLYSLNNLLGIPVLRLHNEFPNIKSSSRTQVNVLITIWFLNLRG